MVIMWGFSMKRRLKDEYPKGVPDLPAPTRVLIRSFLGLEDLASENIFSPNSANFLYQIALKKAYEDRVKIVDYYWKYLTEEAGKGNSLIYINEEIVSNAPKLTNGDELGFEDVSFELRKRGCNVNGESSPDTYIQVGDPPYRVTILGNDQESLQYDVSKNEMNVRGEKTKAPAPTNNPVGTDGNILSARAAMVRESDFEQIVDFVITEHCEAHANLGNSFKRITNADVANFPRFTNGDSVAENLDELSGELGDYFKDKQYTFSFAHEDEDGDDVVFRIEW